MNLFFLRHAKACARGRKWASDEARPLTRDGEKKMFEVARGIKALDLPLDLILTSPSIRAFRTAEILGEILESKRVIETENLAPEAALKSVIGEIKRKYPRSKEIALVGHEPFMSRLISVLLTGGDKLPLELRKAGLCKLTVKSLRLGACGSLEWLLTPNQLVCLGRGKR
jgi:phosphohistidine phosphatase